MEGKSSLSRAERMAVARMLAVGVAHELNQPLQTILGLVQLLDDTALPEAVRRKLRTIRGQADRMSFIVRELGRFAQREVGEFRELDLNTVLGGMVALFRRGGQGGFELEVALSPELGRVQGDADLLEQVFWELLTNSYDAIQGRAGGKIRISTGCQNLWTAITIEDNGPGLEAGLQERAFDPFFTTKGPYIGAGLGLAISHEIVRQHGGMITVESRAGGGSSFTVWLPAQAV